MQAQFLSMMEKPDVDHIEGLSPAISIEQKSTSHNPRSTVARSQKFMIICVCSLLGQGSRAARHMIRATSGANRSARWWDAVLGHAGG